MLAQSARAGLDLPIEKKVCKTDIKNNILTAFMSAFQASIFVESIIPRPRDLGYHMTLLQSCDHITSDTHTANFAS